MKKTKQLFISLLALFGINLYMLINIKGSLILMNARESVQGAPFNTAATVSVKLGRTDKYNWSFTGQMNRDYTQFAPAMNITEYTRYIDLIALFKLAVDAYNIPCILYGGSVLGVYRYHGFIPWDDDFDCLVNVSQKHVLKEALTDIPGHSLYSPNNRSWKFFSNQFPNAGLYQWTWPFIDIFFFIDNSTHVYDITLEKPLDLGPRSDIFPVRKGIFENMVFPVPNNMESYMSKTFDNIEMCVSNYWNHKHETYREFNSSRIPCQKLFGVYPRVHRFDIDNTLCEELRLGHKILYRIERPSMKLLKP